MLFLKSKHKAAQNTIRSFQKVQKKRLAKSIPFVIKTSQQIRNRKKFPQLDKGHL